MYQNRFFSLREDGIAGAYLGSRTKRERENKFSPRKGFKALVGHCHLNTIFCKLTDIQVSNSLLGSTGDVNFRRMVQNPPPPPPMVTAFTRSPILVVIVVVVTHPDNDLRQCRLTSRREK